MPHHPSCLSEEELLEQCSIRHDRRSGPGGQHRNKVETAVVVVHQPSGLRAEGSERRSQVDNRRMALERLRLVLAVQCRSDDLPEAPSELWRSRVHGKSLQVSSQHRDFACLLAECLDRLCGSDYDLPPCAAYFDVSASQLMKLLRQHPPALTSVNQQRAARGLHKLS